MALLDKSGHFYAQYLLPECTGNSATDRSGGSLHFIIQPPSYESDLDAGGIISLLFYRERTGTAWGTFRFNLYFFAGVLFHVIAAILVYVLTGLVLPLGTGYLNMSLFLVYAAMNPNAQFMLYFIIPVKAKWLAWLDGAYFIWAAYPWHFSRRMEEVPMEYTIKQMHWRQLSQS